MQVAEYLRRLPGSLGGPSMLGVDKLSEDDNSWDTVLLIMVNLFNTVDPKVLIIVDFFGDYGTPVTRGKLRCF